MKALAVIPARYASTRLPGKPLVDLAGRPMIQWVHLAASRCDQFARVIVATDDERVAKIVQSFGGEVEMTLPSHQTGTDRVAEVAARHPEFDIVANVQGDQPLVDPAVLAELVAPYDRRDRPDMTTLACPLGAMNANNPNVVKVVVDKNDDALYFSRSPIPYGGPFLHHLGLYAYTSEFLRRFPQLEPTELERSEQLEQLRALAHGHRIRVSATSRPVLEVNTPDDARAARELLESNRR